MGPDWISLCLVLAAFGLVQSVLAGMQAWEHRRFARNRLREIDRRWTTGRAMIFAPCKGQELGLEQSLEALFAQDYPDYEVVFLLESADDRARPLIDRLMAEHPEIPSRLIVTGLAGDCGQKVHNLISAVSRLPCEVEYLVFVDSDARPARHWLRALIAGLGQEGVGATTGYRWLMPTSGGVAPRLLASLNNSIASMLSPKGPMLVWGGSWAIRRETFKRIGLSTAWRNTLSDDLIASRELCRHRLRIRFEPACVVASPVSGNLAEAATFVRRQYIILRHYLPVWWAAALALGGLASAAFWGALLCAAWWLPTHPPRAIALLGCAAALYATYVARGYLRTRIGRQYFPSSAAHETLRKIEPVDLWLGPAVSLAHWLVVLWSATTRTIRWRGIRYRLRPGGATQILQRETFAPVEPVEDRPAAPEPESVPELSVARREAG